MPVTEKKEKIMIRRFLAALAVSGGLALAAPAAQALAMPVPAAARSVQAAPALTSPSVLPAPGWLGVIPGSSRATLSWGAVRGAAAYELRVNPASGGASTHFDRVLAVRTTTVALHPGRYSASVRAGRTARDVHGHWSALRFFTVTAPRTVRSSAAARALAWAFAQAGKPYVYGGAGPWSFDCSGLVMEAYLHADGIALPHNTVAMLYSGKLIRTGSPQPGDLAFYGTGHVELFVRPGVTWGAHHSGTVIGFSYYGGSSWKPTSFYRVA